jgi:hypothetical protein
MNMMGSHCFRKESQEDTPLSLVLRLENTAQTSIKVRAAFTEVDEELQRRKWPEPVFPNECVMYGYGEIQRVTAVREFGGLGVRPPT